MQKTRIYLTGIGGQGTLTATNLLSQIGLDNGLDVTSGEIHGMAQRGGVVASTILFGGYQSPKISPGEADILLGFEPLETYRALCFLAPEAVVVSNSEPLLPIGVALGREEYPAMDVIRNAVEKHASKAYFLPCISLAKEAGTPRQPILFFWEPCAHLGSFPSNSKNLKSVSEPISNPKSWI